MNLIGYEVMTRYLNSSITMKNPTLSKMLWNAQVSGLASCDSWIRLSSLLTATPTKIPAKSTRTLSCCRNLLSLALKVPYTKLPKVGCGSEDSTMHPTKVKQLGMNSDSSAKLRAI